MLNLEREKNEYPALFAYFKERFKGQEDLAAFYIIDCMKVKGRESVFHELLKKTGDKTYSLNTFKSLAYSIIHA